MGNVLSVFFFFLFSFVFFFYFIFLLSVFCSWVHRRLQQQWQLQGSPPVHTNSSAGQVHPAVPARLPAPPWSPNVHEDSSAHQVHPAVPAHAPAPGGLNSHRFTLSPEPGLRLCIVVTCKILSSSNQQWDPPPRVWRPPSRKKPVLPPHNFAGSRNTVGTAPGQTPKAEAGAAEEELEAMEVDDEVLGKDHLRSSSDSPMEWEDTQPKDAAALAASSCSLPTAGSQSLDGPPRNGGGGELRGPYPLNVPADPRKDSESPQADVQDQHPGHSKSGMGE
nr:uncharacterized protein LOC110567499 [Aotus nancymaae]